MTDIYDRAAATMQRTLQPRPTGKGAPITLTKAEPGAYNPDTGTAAPVLTTFEGFAFRRTYSTRDIDGTLIRSGDVKFLVSPLQTNGSVLPLPAAPDTLTFEGAVYSVVACWPMDYAGKLVGMTVQARL